MCQQKCIIIRILSSKCANVFITCRKSFVRSYLHCAISTPNEIRNTFGIELDRELNKYHYLYFNLRNIGLASKIVPGSIKISNHVESPIRSFWHKHQDRCRFIIIIIIICTRVAPVVEYNISCYTFEVSYAYRCG